MDQAEQSVQLVCSLAELKQTRGGWKCADKFKPCYKTLLGHTLLYSHSQPSAAKTAVNLLSWPVGVRGNEHEDRLESTAETAVYLQVGNYTC